MLNYGQILRFVKLVFDSLQPSFRPARPGLLTSGGDFRPIPRQERFLARTRPQEALQRFSLRHRGCDAGQEDP